MPNPVLLLLDSFKLRSLGFLFSWNERFRLLALERRKKSCFTAGLLLLDILVVLLAATDSLSLFYELRDLPRLEACYYSFKLPNFLYESLELCKLLLLLFFKEVFCRLFVSDVFDTVDRLLSRALTPFFFLLFTVVKFSTSRLN